MLAFSTTLGLSEVSAKKPDWCAGPDHWAAVHAFLELRGAGIVTNSDLDFTKTKTELLSTEKIGKDLYRQVILVNLQSKSGKLIKAIAVSDASSEECSMGDVRVFLVSPELGSEPQKPN